MQISKSEILNPESSDNAAVKLALAETHIIQETKTYLESQGVLLDSFSARARSDTIILVKNIPYGTTADQIRELFEPHGALTRVLAPPAGTMAVVEFARADEAGKAFRAVAYRRLGNSVIYLEKGPMGMFGEGPVGQTVNSGAEASDAHVVKIAEQAVGEGEEEPTLGAGTTIFVKNLSFATSTERLTQMFGSLPSFSFARVQMKPDPKRPDGPRLSMGYGFVGFKDVEGAKKAIKSMQGFVLDGHALHVKFAGRGAEEVEDKGKGGASAKSRTTKMIVKNVPFEATKKDIRELFGYASLHLLVLIYRSWNIVARTVISNQCVCPRNSTLGLADLRSWTLYLGTKLRTLMLLFAIHIYSDGIWCSSGRKRQNRIWMSFARRLVSGSAQGAICLGGSGNLTWERTRRTM
jgi:multiple RNA-binding domain-containing protein 1